MDDDLKRELLVSGLPAIAVPLVRAGASHYFTMKQLDKQEEMAVNVAERRAQGMHAMQAGAGGGAAAPPDAPPMDSPGDVYDELERLRGETDCGFCHRAIDMLMEAPPDEAQQGYREISAYVRETERIAEQDIGQNQAEQVVTDLIEDWDVVPKYVAGMT